MRILKKLMGICEESLTFKIIVRFCRTGKMVLKGILTDKIISQREEYLNGNFLQESYVIRYIKKAYEYLKSIAVLVCPTSFAIQGIGDLKRIMKIIPIKAVSILIISACFTYILAAMLNRVQIPIHVMLLELLFLFLGIGGLFCNASWEEIKQASFIFHYFRRECKK